MRTLGGTKARRRRVLVVLECLHCHLPLAVPIRSTVVRTASDGIDRMGLRRPSDKREQLLNR